MESEDRLDEAIKQTRRARKDLDDSPLSPFRSLMLKMAETRLSSVYKSMTGEQWVPPRDCPPSPDEVFDEEHEGAKESGS
jgi:hypothetical protein